MKIFSPVFGPVQSMDRQYRKRCKQKHQSLIYMYHVYLCIQYKETCPPRNCKKSWKKSENGKVFLWTSMSRIFSPRQMYIVMHRRQTTYYPCYIHTKVFRNKCTSICPFRPHLDVEMRIKARHLTGKHCNALQWVNHTHWSNITLGYQEFLHPLGRSDAIFKGFHSSNNRYVQVG